MILSTTCIDTSINPFDRGDLWKSIPVYQRFPCSLFFFLMGQWRFKIISQSWRSNMVKACSHCAWRRWPWLKFFAQRIFVNPFQGVKTPVLTVPMSAVTCKGEVGTRWSPCIAISACASASSTTALHVKGTWRPSQQPLPLCLDTFSNGTGYLLIEQDCFTLFSIWAESNLHANPKYSQFKLMYRSGTLVRVKRAAVTNTSECRHLLCNVQMSFNAVVSGQWVTFLHIIIQGPTLLPSVASDTL